MSWFKIPFDLIELCSVKVMVGAIDVATNAIETPTEVAATLRGALDFVDVENLYPSTTSMAPLSRNIARG
jgi:5-methyltetrahydropteroyltriglutamate--homocysteine methyltransferase